MSTLTVRDVGEDLVRRLQMRAAENGRSVEEEHREILRKALLGGESQQVERDLVGERLAEFRRRLAGRGGPSVAELIEESRNERMAQLMRGREGA